MKVNFNILMKINVNSNENKNINTATTAEWSENNRKKRTNVQTDVDWLVIKTGAHILYISWNVTNSLCACQMLPLDGLHSTISFTSNDLALEMSTRQKKNIITNIVCNTHISFLVYCFVGISE